MAAGMRTRMVSSVAIAGVLACAPLAAWVAGLVSTSKVDDANADYLQRPLGWSQAARTAAGVTSLAVVVLAVVVVLRAGSQAKLTDPAVLAPLAAGSAFVGLAYHVVTAPVIGANIGGGLLMMLGVPMVAALVVIAVRNARRSGA